MTNCSGKRDGARNTESTWIRVVAAGGGPWRTLASTVQSFDFDCSFLFPVSYPVVLSSCLRGWGDLILSLDCFFVWCRYSGVPYVRLRNCASLAEELILIIR